MRGNPLAQFGKGPLKKGWKQHLVSGLLHGLELKDEGFDASVLCEFRARLLAH
jgi:hypothetical protein